MQIGPVTAGELLGWGLSVVCLLATLWTRATVAELKAHVLEQQEKRCAECRKELVSRREFDLLARQGVEQHG